MSQLKNGALTAANGNGCIRILHVDDDQSILEVSKQILMDMDGSFEIDHACCVDEAFQKLEKQSYDAVVSDYEMPQKNGLNFLAELRGKRNDIPFILFTGKGREEVAIKALNLGANYYLNKVGSPETMYGELAHAIQRAVKSVRVESALKASEERFRAVFEGSSDGILAADPETKHFVFANPKMGELTGYSLNELTKLGIGDIHHKKDLSHVLDEFEKQLKGEILLALDIPVLKKDGQIVYCDVNSRLVNIENRVVMAGFFRDTTERKKAENLRAYAEADLCDKEKRFRAIFDKSFQFALILDINGNILEMNELCYMVHGPLAKAAMGKPLWDAAWWNQFPEVQEKTKSAIQSCQVGKIVNDEVKFIDKNFQIHHGIRIFSPIADENGKLRFISVVGLDISERKKAEQEIQSLARFPNENPLAVLRVDKNGTLLYANPPAEKLLDHLEIRVGDAMPEQWRKTVFEALESKSRLLLEEEANERVFSFSVTPVVSEGYVNVYGSDITERKQAEENLQKSKALLLETERTGKIGGWEFDVNTLTQTWTEETFRILEIDLAHGEPTVPKGIEFINPKYRSMANEAIQRAIEHGEPYDQEWEITTTKGNTRWVHAVAKANRENGKIKSISGSFQDITELRQGERNLRVSEERLKKAQAVAHIGHWEWTVQTGAFVWGEEHYRIFGLPPETVPSIENFLGAVHPDDVAFVKQSIDDALKGKICNIDFRIIRPDGVERVLKGQGEVEFDVEGKPTRMFGTMQDITESKRIEGDLRRSEEKYRGLFESIQDGIVITDAKGFVESANQAAAIMFGYKNKEELLNAPAVTLWTDPQDRRVLFELLEEKGTVKDYEVKLKRRDGTAFDARVTVTLQRDLQGKVLRVETILRDITERKTAKAEIARLASFPTLNPDPIVEVDFEGNIRYANFAAERVFPDLKKAGLSHPFFSGWEKAVAGFKEKKQQTVSKDIKIGDSWFHQQFQLVLGTTQVRIYVLNVTEEKEAHEKLAFSERKYRELADSLPEIVFEADDKGIPTFLNRQALEIMGYSEGEVKQMNILQFLVPEDRQRARENIQRRMQGEKSVGNEYTLTRKDHTTFPAIIFTEKIFTQEGKPSGLRGVIVNISQTKKDAEDLQLLNEKLRVVGGLTMHDVGNKLTVVGSNVYLLKKRIGDKPELVKYLNAIDAAVESSSRLFEFSRLYEKIGAEKPVKVNVAECFNQAAALLPNLDKIEIVNECAGLEVLADSLFMQLFYNLIDNSLTHGEKVTQIRLHFSKVDDGVKLFYEDNGVGVPDINKSKLFEAGFTTGKGSGLGLSLVNKMIEVYGWKIQEAGEPGKGARFVVSIPLGAISGSDKKAID